MTPHEETEQRVALLTSELGNATEYTFLVPGWPPVNANEGLHWFRATLREGFYAAYKIDHATKVVRFKSWEFGELEPSWASVVQAT
jgi:hypothetical protein